MANTPIKSFLQSFTRQQSSTIQFVRTFLLSPQFLLEEVVAENELLYQSKKTGQTVASISVRKNFFILFLAPVQSSALLQKLLEDGFRTSYKKLDLRNDGIHFHRTDDLHLPTLQEILLAGKVQIKH